MTANLLLVLKLSIVTLIFAVGLGSTPADLDVSLAAPEGAPALAPRDVRGGAARRARSR